MGSGKAWSPSEIAQLTALAYEGKRYSEIGAAIGRSAQSVKNYMFTRKVGGRDLQNRFRHKTPGDFAERYATTSLKGLARHYGFSEKVAARIAAQLGLKRPEPAPKPVKTAPVKPSPHRLRNNAYMTAPRAPVSQAVMNEAGRAAEYLRPDYVPVYRCDQDGRLNPGGRWWRCGRRVFSDSQIIERAAEVKARRARMRGVAA